MHRSECISLLRIRNIWSSDRVYRVEVILKVMIRSRFEKIGEMIHVNNNERNLSKTDPNYDKLYKIRPLYYGLNKNIRKVCNSSSFVSIDKTIILFKRRSIRKQYNPIKPIKRGYKGWCRANPQMKMFQKKILKGGSPCKCLKISHILKMFLKEIK